MVETTISMLLNNGRIAPALVKQLCMLSRTYKPACLIPRGLQLETEGVHGLGC